MSSAGFLTVFGVPVTAFMAENVFLLPHLVFQMYYFAVFSRNIITKNFDGIAERYTFAPSLKIHINQLKNGIMKKLMLAAAMMVATISASAQVYVGGSLGFESTKENKDADNLTKFSINPEVGYNLDENWAVGIQLGYSNVEIMTDKRESKFTIAPYARYTFAKSGIASFFVDGGISFITLGADTKGSVFGVGICPGVKLAVSNKVDLVAKLGNIGYRSANDDAVATSSFKKNEFNFGIDGNTLQFGVYFNL